MAGQIPFLFDIPTVSQLTDKIKLQLEQNFSDILVEGETSNVTQSRNGHYYFTLKDAGASLPCVIWRGTAQQLGLTLTDGQHIVAGGDLQVYAPHGRYQMVVNLVEHAGIGKLQQAYEQLKTKLQAEGLFDEIHKKQLPRFPQKIGVVTSASGAAFQDIRSTLAKRWPVAQIKLYHASVQGERAAAEIVKGIEYFSANADVDVLIIGRGGGSLEDLWPFNEEIVARAVFDSRIPIISAVGHEVDFSISDFVADMRAATPTHAAVLATPDIDEIRFLLEELARKLELTTRRSLQFYKDRINSMAKSYALLAVKQKLESARVGVSSLRQRLNYQQQVIARGHREHLSQLIHLLDKLNPNEALEKGYVRVWQHGKWIKKASDLNTMQALELEWEKERTKIEK